MKILHNKYRTIITSLILVVTSLIFILSFLSLSSCRSAEHDNIVVGGGIAAVKINLLGSEYKGSSRDVSQVQKHITFFNPSTAIVAELNSTEPTRSIPGDQIGNGIQFRVIAYRFNDNTYQTHQDYTVGQPAQPMMLDGGEKYNIIVYSYGSSSTLPELSTGEKTNLINAQILYDDNNKNLMYQKIVFTPDGYNPANTLDIKLRNIVTQFTVSISTNVYSINSIDNVMVGPHYKDGTFSLFNGIMLYPATSSNQNITFNSQSFPSATIKSDPIFINASTENTNSGFFNAKVNINGEAKTVNLPNSFKITPEYKSNLTINLRKCGAMVLGKWRDFMCYNLGADSSEYPFQIAKNLHGAKYQWGATTGEESRYVSQYYDQLTDNKPDTGWKLTGILYNDHNKDWNSGTETSPIKASKDPCPSGFRIPTAREWQSVIDWNSLSRIGTFENSITNYSSGLRVGSDLYLPAAGYRTREEGWLKWRGSAGGYHSSKAEKYESGGIIPDPNEDGLISPHLFYFDKTTVEMQSFSGWEAQNGLPIRCISQN
ncbi:hypothetical protein HZQ27_11700 [Elizabethkingia anophelis]|nr:hypothetical protein [Elizabethkingia anophelis]